MNAILEIHYASAMKRLAKSEGNKPRHLCPTYSPGQRFGPVDTEKLSERAQMALEAVSESKHPISTAGVRQAIIDKYGENRNPYNLSHFLGQLKAQGLIRNLSEPRMLASWVATEGGEG